jgi:hypothetical protein
MAEEEKPNFDPDFREDERLFHYTSPQGLYGILESGCLWATHFRFLNDNSEVFRARSPLTKIVGKAIHCYLAAAKVNKQIKIPDGENVKHEADRQAAYLVDAMYKAALGSPEDGMAGIGHPYVFSTFCCSPQVAEDFNNGALVHWGAYARGGGYALQLDPHKLHQLLNEESKAFYSLGFISRKLGYLANDEFPKDFADWVDKICASAVAWSSQLINGDNLENVDFGKSLAPFLSLICSSKDPFFAPEKEARVTIFHPLKVDNIPTVPHEVNIRHAGAVPVPYLKILEGLLLSEDCPIDRIVIGPHPDAERRRIALTSFLRSKKLGSIEVAQSTVPYITQLN